MIQSTITAKGQTTPPKPVRDSLDLAPGDQVRYVVEADGVRIVKVRTVMALAGMLRRPGPAVSLADMDAAIAGAPEG